MTIESHLGESPPSSLTRKAQEFLRVAVLHPGRQRPTSTASFHHHKTRSPNLHPVKPRRGAPIVSTLIHPTTSNSNPSSATGGGLGFSNMFRRRRSAGNHPSSELYDDASSSDVEIANGSTMIGAPSTNPTAPSHQICLVPYHDKRRNLRFGTISRNPCEGDPALSICRSTDRSALGLAAVNALNSTKPALKN
jgi:hypothetical protein